MNHEIRNTEFYVFLAGLQEKNIDVGECLNAAIKTLVSHGYTYTKGAERWRPPHGEKPNFNLRDVVEDMEHIGYVGKRSRNFYEHGVRDRSDPEVWPVYAFKEDLEK